MERFDASDEFRPAAGSTAKQEYLYWMHFAEGTLTPVLLVGLIANGIRKAPVPFFVKPVVKTIAEKIDAAYTTRELDKQLSFIESHLTAHEYFAGESFTAADVQMSYPIDVLALQGALGVRYPNTLGWLDRMKARPAYQAAVARGGANALPSMRR